MVAVGDSSPLLLFSRIGRLQLLRLTFDEVVIPPEVEREVVAAGRGRPGADEIASAAWVRVDATTAPSHPLLQGLGTGEAAAIRLAMVARPTDGLILDDLQARRVAVSLGLRVADCDGVLVLAKQDGSIPAVAPLLQELRRAGLYLCDAAARDILLKANEA